MGASDRRGHARPRSAQALSGRDEGEAHFSRSRSMSSCRSSMCFDATSGSRPPPFDLFPRCGPKRRAHSVARTRHHELVRTCTHPFLCSGAVTRQGPRRTGTGRLLPTRRAQCRLGKSATASKGRRVAPGCCCVRDVFGRRSPWRCPPDHGPMVARWAAGSSRQKRTCTSCAPDGITMLHGEAGQPTVPLRSVAGTPSRPYRRR